MLRELRAYAPLVTPESYVVVADGIMQDLVGAPRANPDWGTNNPRTAVRAFVAEDPRFRLEEPAFLFNEGSVRSRVTYWPDAYLRRVSP